MAQPVSARALRLPPTRAWQAHTHLLAHLRSKVVGKWYGKKEEQARLCSPEGLLEAYAQVQRQHDISRGDFPLPSRMASVLRSYDFAEFYKPSVERSKKLRLLRELTECDIPELITKLHSVQKRRGSKEEIVEGFRPVRKNRPPPPEHLFLKSAPEDEAPRTAGRAGVLRAMRRSPFSQPSEHIVEAPAGGEQAVVDGATAPDPRAADSEAESGDPSEDGPDRDGETDRAEPPVVAEEIAQEIAEQDDVERADAAVQVPESLAPETVVLPEAELAANDASAPQAAPQQTVRPQPLAQGQPLVEPQQTPGPHVQPEPPQVQPQQAQPQPPQQMHELTAPMQAVQPQPLPAMQPGQQAQALGTPAAAALPTGPVSGSFGSPDGVNVASFANKATGLFASFRSALSETKSALALAIADGEGASRAQGEGSPPQQGWQPPAGPYPSQRQWQEPPHPHGQHWHPGRMQHAPPQGYRAGEQPGWGPPDGQQQPQPDWQPPRQGWQQPPPQQRWQQPPEPQPQQRWQQPLEPQPQQWQNGLRQGWQTAQAPSIRGQDAQTVPRRGAGAPGEAGYASGAASGGSNSFAAWQTSNGAVAGEQPLAGDAPAQFDGRWALDVAGTGPPPQPARNFPPHEQPPAGAHAGLTAPEGTSVGAGFARVGYAEREPVGNAAADVGKPSVPEGAHAPEERGAGAAMGGTDWLGAPPPPAVPTSAWEVVEVAVEPSGSGGEEATGREAKGDRGEEALGRETEGDALPRPLAEPMEMSEGEAAAWAAADAAMADAARGEAEVARSANPVPPPWPPSSSSS